MDDQRIGCWNIETGFDDRGGQKDVIFAVVVGRHDVIEHRCGHLSMRNGDMDLWDILVEKILGARQILNTRANIEPLSAAILLPQKRFADGDRIEWRVE